MSGWNYSQYTDHNDYNTRGTKYLKSASIRLILSHTPPHLLDLAFIFSHILSHSLNRPYILVHTCPHLLNLSFIFSRILPHSLDFSYILTRPLSHSLDVLFILSHTLPHSPNLSFIVTHASWLALFCTLFHSRTRLLGLSLSRSKLPTPFTFSLLSPTCTVVFQFMEAFLLRLFFSWFIRPKWT